MTHHFVTGLPARPPEHQAGHGARHLQVAWAAGAPGRMPGHGQATGIANGSTKPQAAHHMPLPRMRHYPRTPVGQRKEPAAMKQPPDRDVVGHPQGTRPPEYVIVTWVSAQLRDRIQRNGAALAQDRQDPGRHRHGRRAEPEAELEAEP
jgi:hypothetical protein